MLLHAHRSDRLAAMQMLSSWLLVCPVGISAADCIMDGLTGALAAMVVSDFLARRRAAEEPHSVVTVPQYDFE